MNHRLISAIGLVILVGVTACSHRPPPRTIMLPPRVDLTSHQIIGVTEFDCDRKGGLAPLATRRFVEMARRDQGVLRMVDLGASRTALRSAGQTSWSPAAYKAVGAANGVQSIFSGELRISSVKPEVTIAGMLRSGQVTARVDAELVVQLVEATTGASLWSGSARATRSLGHVSVLGGGQVAFDAADPDQAYGEMVDALVEQVTRDFRVSWARQ